MQTLDLVREAAVGLHRATAYKKFASALGALSIEEKAMSNMNDAVGLRIPYASRDGQTRIHTEYEYEPSSATLWGYMAQKGNPCFSLALLNEIREFDAELQANGGLLDIAGETYPVRYYICGSRIPRVFNLGGDLGLFMLLIKARDRGALVRYAAKCIDNLDARINHYGCRNITTLALVQGDALGGGFECALSSDVIVAEESAQMGLPEILFNLFPGMGAYQLLARRIGVRAAEELILSGRVQPARKLHEMGVVDVLAKDGQGESAAQQWIAANRRRQNGTQAVFGLRQIVNPVSRAELDAVAESWVDAALNLSERDLRMMSWLVRAQLERGPRAEPAAAVEVVPAVANA
jgi:DSF synthase